MLRQKYVAEGASLKQIAKELLCSQTAVRDALIRAGIPLRPRGAAGHSSTVNYGTKLSRGRRAPCAVEAKVVKTILDLRHDGMSFDKIAQVLTKVGVPTKTRRKKWNGGCVRAIYLRHRPGAKGD